MATLHRERLVAQQLLAIDGDHLGEVGLGGLVHAAAVDARIEERAEADVGEEAGPAGADLAEQLHGDAARQHVGLDLVVLGELLHARRPHPVAADHLPDHAFVGEAVHAARLAVADAERMDDGEVARMAAGQKPLLDRLVQAGGLDQAAAAADQRDGVAVVDERHGRLGRHEFVDGHRAFLRRAWIRTAAGRWTAVPSPGRSWCRWWGSRRRACGPAAARSRGWCRSRCGGGG